MLQNKVQGTFTLLVNETREGKRTYRIAIQSKNSNNEYSSAYCNVHFKKEDKEKMDKYNFNPTILKIEIIDGWLTCDVREHYNVVGIFATQFKLHTLQEWQESLKPEDKNVASPF